MTKMTSPKQICLCILVSLVLMTNGLSIDEQLQRLSEKYEILLERDFKMEEKVNQLEAKVQQQELLLSALHNERKAVPPLDITNVNQQAERSAIFRTCHETRLADPSITSGWHWIDPDGQGVGDDPIYVYCDASTGSTSVTHDSESKISVGHCADPGCYSRVINYSATNRQLSALAELSTECHQSIRYDCNYATLEFDDIPYSWWNDKNGKPQYFWAGRDASVHTCQCGIDRNCVESTKKCNCDSVAPLPLNDSGIITDKNYLPITRLNFGRTQLSTSSGEHTLGRLECSGQTTLNTMPTSCKDLWLIGHALSGFYSVKGTKQVETIYCDFTKTSSDSNFQTWIGYADVKSSPTYFFVQKLNGFSELYTPIPFETERINVGAAMNKTTGIFTAPQSGTYFFSFSGLVLSYTEGFFKVFLHVNGASITGAISANVRGHSMMTQQSTLKLKAGDKVWLEVGNITNDGHLHGNAEYFTHFTGYLLEEDFAW